MRAKTVAVILFLFSAVPLLHGAGRSTAFDGAPGWFVIGEHFASAKEAMAKTDDYAKRDVYAAVVDTDYFAALPQNRMVIVFGSFREIAAAQGFLGTLKTKGVSANVQPSGPFNLKATAGRKRLLRLYGQLDPVVACPTQIEIEHEDFEALGWTGPSCRWEVWFPVGEKASGAITVSANPETDEKPKGCVDETWGWYDRHATAAFVATDREVRFTWSPSPDCNGE